MVRRRLLSSALLEEEGEELRDLGCGLECWVSSVSCWRFLLARRWGGSSGPTVAMIKRFKLCRGREAVERLVFLAWY